MQENDREDNDLRIEPANPFPIWCDHIYEGCSRLFILSCVLRLTDISSRSTVCIPIIFLELIALRWTLSRRVDAAGRAMNSSPCANSRTTFKSSFHCLFLLFHNDSGTSMSPITRLESLIVPVDRVRLLHDDQDQPCKGPGVTPLGASADPKRYARWIWKRGLANEAICRTVTS